MAGPKPGVISCGWIDRRYEMPALDRAVYGEYQPPGSGLAEYTEPLVPGLPPCPLGGPGDLLWEYAGYSYQWRPWLRWLPFRWGWMVPVAVYRPGEGDRSFD